MAELLGSPACSLRFAVESVNWPFELDLVA